MTLHGRVAVIAGSMQGVGAAIAIELANQGASVAVLDVERTPDVVIRDISVEDLSPGFLRDQAITGRLIRVTSDTSDRRAREAILARVEAALGPVDLLVHVSADHGPQSAAGMSEDEWDEVVDANLHDFYRMARVVVPGMAERGFGHVVAVIGDESRRGVEHFSHVSAAGWAAIGLAKSIAIEVIARNVAVNVVATGPVRGTADQPMSTEAIASVLTQRNSDRHPWVEVNDVVAGVVFLATRSGIGMTGSVLDVSNGVVAFNAS